MKPQLNKDGFVVLKDSEVVVPATHRLSPELKTDIKGRVTFEVKSSSHGLELVIAHWPEQKGVFPEVGAPEYFIPYGRTEIMLPLDVAVDHGFISRKERQEAVELLRAGGYL
jgi:hypothetical protein